MNNYQESLILRKIFNLFEIDIVFDLGSNLGQYYKRLREDVGYKGHVVSVEPIMEHCNSMKAFIDSDPKLYIENIAIAENAGMSRFFKMKNTQFSSLQNPIQSYTNLFNKMNVIEEEREVYCTTLADLFNKYKSILNFHCPFLKMDTQGNDVSVVSGGVSVIQEFCAFQSELSVTKIYQDSVDFREALYFYENLGFSISSLFLPNLGHFPKLIDIDVIMINKKML